MMKFMNAILLLAMPFSAPLAQDNGSANHYDVVAIHQSDPMSNNETMNYNKGQLRGVGITPRFLIQSAFGIKDFQIVNLPAEMRAIKYDITAKVDDVSKERAWNDPAAQQVNEERLQAILVQRFHFLYHKESKIMPVYVLKGLPSGVKLQKSSSEGGHMRLHTSEMGAEIDAENQSMADLARELSMITGRYVIDGTALTGRYTFQLPYVPDDGQGGDGYPLKTALHQVLGLTLDDDKAPVETVVVDHIEKPDGN